MMLAGTDITTHSRGGTADANNSYNQSSVTYDVNTQTYEDIKCKLDDMFNLNYVYYGMNHTGEVGICNATHDLALCWPTTLGGTEVVLPCPTDLEGTATKYCYPNGTWHHWTNYTGCRYPGDEIDPHHSFIQRVMYLIGYSISTVALVIALAIFLHFRALRCLRNIIHCHLIVTFILRNVTWMILHTTLLKMANTETVAVEWLCKLFIAFYNYLHVTNFFWMLVEGIYLLFLVVFAYSHDKIKIWYLIIVGWILPIPVIVAWAIVRYKFDNGKCWIKTDSLYHYIHVVPVLLVLFINAVIMVIIVYILITKLRATNCAHTRQSRKAIKATLILCPLLGMTYIIFITPYSNNHIEKLIYTYVNVILQSLQGLEVAVFYCFLNGEVKSVVKNKFSRWQDERSVATRYTRASVVSTTDQTATTYRTIHENGRNGRKKASNSMKQWERDIPLTSADDDDDNHCVDEML